MARLSPQRIRQSLRDIARVASVMFDGELCGQVVTDRSWKWMADFDPDDRWSAHDNFDYEHEPFVAAKKLLLRLERLAPPGLRVSCSLWTAVPTLPDRATCVIQNGGPARWQRFSDLHHPLHPAMRAALQTGQPQEVPPEDSGVLTVLAPVRDSLKEVAGFIEVSASQSEPAIAW